MAGQTVNSVTSAVTGELTSRVFSGLIRRYGKDASTREKLQRLEMLLIKIHSAVEASEKRTIENSWLLQWREKLKEAVSQGDDVLASFPQQSNDAQDTSNTNSHQQHGEAVSSCASAPATDVRVLPFTRNPLFGIVQGIRSAGKTLFVRGNDDMERLNKILARLEKLSSDIGEFIRLLHLEALPKVDQIPCSTALSTKAHGPTENMRETREKKRIKHSATHNIPSGPLIVSEPSPEEEKTDEFMDEFIFCELESHFEYDSAVFPKKQLLLQDRLEAAFTEICKAVELAQVHDLEDLEWLAYWAGILIEAKEQGHDFLGTTSACKTASTEDNEPAVERDQEEDELTTLVHRLEGLVRDVEYFSKLVYLSPAR